MIRTPSHVPLPLKIAFVFIPLWCCGRYSGIAWKRSRCRCKCSYSDASAFKMEDTDGSGIANSFTYLLTKLARLVS